MRHNASPENFFRKFRSFRCSLFLEGFRGKRCGGPRETKWCRRGVPRGGFRAVRNRKAGACRVRAGGFRGDRLRLRRGRERTGAARRAAAHSGRAAQPALLTLPHTALPLSRHGTSEGRAWMWTRPQRPHRACGRRVELERGCALAHLVSFCLLRPRQRWLLTRQARRARPRPRARRTIGEGGDEAQGQRR